MRGRVSVACVMRSLAAETDRLLWVRVRVGRVAHTAALALRATCALPLPEWRVSHSTREAPSCEIAISVRVGVGVRGGAVLWGSGPTSAWARARRGESCAIAISISPSSEKEAERTKGRALSTLGEPTPNLQLLSWGLPRDTGGGGPTHAVSDAACPRVESVLVWPRVAWVAPERAPERRAPTWTRIPTGCSCRRRPCPSACAAWPARGGGGAGEGGGGVVWRWWQQAVVEVGLHGLDVALEEIDLEAALVVRALCSERGEGSSGPGQAALTRSAHGRRIVCR